MLIVPAVRFASTPSPKRLRMEYGRHASTYFAARSLPPALQPVPFPRVSFDGLLLVTVTVTATVTATWYKILNNTDGYISCNADRQTNGVRGTPKSRGRSNSSSRSRGRRGKSRSGSKPKVGGKGERLRRGICGSEGTPGVHPRVSCVDINVAAGM